jgi:hypothetical protein
MNGQRQGLDLEQKMLDSVLEHTTPEGYYLFASLDTPGTWKPDQRTADGQAFLDLGGRTARYIKLEITTKGEGVRMGEVRLWGWPVGR